MQDADDAQPLNQRGRRGPISKEESWLAREIAKAEEGEVPSPEVGKARDVAKHTERKSADKTKQ